jgi:LuxR family transcriptional regulator, maltose regulon positive regulatory protein
VDRPRLFAELDAGTAGGVTLVSAPAGSGKTVLLSSWLDRSRANGAVAWVSVDRDETDATRFWGAVVDALRDAGALSAGDPLATLAPAPLAGQREYAERLLAGLARLPKPTVLIVDDLHELRSEDALDTLEHLIEKTPPELRIILSTRRDPKLGLHRLRLADKLTEIRGSDLEFTESEASELLADAGVELQPTELERLHGRTEGWAAGLRLAALSLARHDEPARFVDEFSGSERTVADYLLEEVLAREGVEARELLLSTCILERVSPELADTLTGQTGSGRLLMELDQSNALVSAVDVSRSWYRYHHLLADLLRLELQREWPERVAGLHRTAATWLAAHGHMTEAIRHAEQAEDWDLAVDLLARHWVDLLLGGEETTLRSLLAELPASVIDSDAEAAAIAAAGRIGEARWAEVERLIGRARATLDAVPPDRRRRAELGVGTVELLLGRRVGGVEEVPGIDALLAGEGLDLDLHALAAMNAGIAETWAFRIPEARAHLEEALELGRRAGRPYIEVGTLTNLGFISIVTLDAIRGEELLRQAIAVAERVGWSTEEMLGVTYMGLGTVLVDRGRVREGSEWLERADPILSDGSEAAAVPVLRHAQGMVAIGSGRFDEAFERWAEAERIARALRTEHFLMIPAVQWQLRARLGLGQLDEVDAAVAEARARGEKGAEWRNLEARLFLAREDPGAAATALEPALAGEAPFFHLNIEIETLLLDGLARSGIGDAGAARRSIERALALAQPQGRMWVISTIPGIVELLRRHPVHQTAYAGFLKDLLDHLEGHELPSDGDGELQEPLTDRELAVLRFLPTNLSAGEIGGEMFLSVHTVKTHMRRLYAKLDAHTRAEAVQRARSVGLLGPARR